MSLIHIFVIFLLSFQSVDNLHIRPATYLSSNHYSLRNPLRIEYLRLSSSQIDTDKEKIIHGGFNHVGIIVSNNEASKKYYMELFDFEDDTHLRPNLTFPGSFLRFGNHQVHLMELPNPDSKDNRPEYGGRDRHMALWINNIDIIRKRLEKRGIAYNLSKSGRRSLFCRDLDGNAFEFVEDASLNKK
jgi:glyoxylase I family protein